MITLPLLTAHRSLWEVSSSYLETHWSIFKNHIAVVPNDIAATLAFFDRDETHTGLLEREDHDVLFVCNVSDPRVDLTNFIFETLLDTARAEGVSAVIAQALPAQQARSGGRCRRIRVLTDSDIAFDQLMTVSSSRAQLAHWWEGRPAFDGKLR